MTRYTFHCPLIICFLFLLNTHVSHAQYPDNYSAEVMKRIEQVENNLISWVKLDGQKNWSIHDRMKELNVNGLSIAVISGYKIDWVKSYGYADTTFSQRVTDSTLFQVASIGKTVNAMAQLQLAENGYTELDSDINNYLSSWKFPYDSASKGKIISLRNILSHTAGLSVHGFDGYKKGISLPSLIQILDGQPPSNSPPVRSLFEPGLKFEYSGGGYEISELMLEDITGQSYPAYVHQNIFAQLGMTNTFFMQEPGFNSENRLATAYRFDGADIGSKYHVYPENACGAGLLSTAEDIAKLVIEIELSLEGRSNKILSKEMTRKMLVTFFEYGKVPDNGPNIALGTFIEERGKKRYFQHSGLNEGFSSQYYGSFEDGNGVVILMNSDFTEFAAEIVNSVATVYGWGDFYPFVPKQIISVSDAVLEKYTGSYQFENAPEGPEIIREDGSLFLVPPNSPVKWKMYFTAENEFFMLDAKWVTQQFFSDESGRVKGFNIVGDDYKFPVLKKD